MGKAQDIESILERQARFWEVRERIASEGGEPARRALAHLSQGPWITISRQIGSLGDDVGKCLAAELHWQVFDKEIVRAIAATSNTREAVLSRLDERAIGSINDYLAQMVVPGDPGQAGYLEHMVRVVWGLARQGNAIILGRGANYFLDPRFGLRVRLIAPFDARVERVAARGSLSRIDAEATVRRHDEHQAAFVRQVFGRPIDDAAGFDLVINTGGLGVDVAACTILAALRHKLQARG